MDIRELPVALDWKTQARGGVEIRPVEVRDFPDVAKAAADPGIWTGHPVPDRWKAEVFEPYFRSLVKAGGTVLVKDLDGQVIGMSRYYASSDAPDGVGIGFTFLVRAHWGGGTNLEMKRLMLGRIFDVAPEAWFHIAPTNIRSQKATAKLGADRVDNRTLDLGAGAVEWVRMRLDRAAWHQR